MMGKTIVSFAVGACVSLVASASERQMIAPYFLAQPATSSTQLPKPELWSKNEVPTIRDATPPDNGKWTREDAQKLHNQYLKKNFSIPAAWNNGRILLDFEIINGNTIIFINGKRAGERLGPYGSIDITSFAVPGQQNELLIFNTRDYTDVSRKFETDPLRYTARGPRSFAGELSMDRWPFGINSPVWLVYHPAPAAITDSWSETSFRKKEITIRAELDVQKPVADAVLKTEILDAKGTRVMEFQQDHLTLSAGKQNVALTRKWENPVLWELDGGTVYSAKLTLFDAAGKQLDRDQFEFGFREIWTEGRQVILNGHPLRFRVEWSYFGINENSISFLKLLGRNTLYFQSNPSGWWRDWGREAFVFPQDTLSLCDRNGIGVLLPVPTLNFGRERFLNDPLIREQYESECSQLMKRYRRHPSILAWCVSMNSFNPRDGIHPDTMGRRVQYKQPQGKVLEKGVRLVKSFDPTRLVYSHADGNLSDLATGNCYPNFAPVQEVEDWPELWSKSGDMPWWACEFAAIYDGSYFKGKSFFLTEYAAIYFGPDAYARETDRQLAETIQLGLNNSGHGQDMPKVAQYTPLYYDLQKVYVEAIDRAWRTYGVLGWHYFNFHLGYGEPPETVRENLFARYSVMKTPVAKRPEWANPQFDYYAKNMQPLLMYVAGAPDHTDKTHSFYTGETVEKQLAMVWDGPRGLTLKSTWKLLDSKGTEAASGTLPDQVLKAGDIRFLPIRFTAPEVAEKTAYILEVRTSGTPEGSRTDRFDLQVFPKLSALQVNRRVRIYDPAGRSGWLRQLIPAAIPFDPAEKAQPGDVIVFGRESLKLGDRLPVTPEDLLHGTVVIFLEQKPEIWEALGFRNYEAGARRIFPAVAYSSILNHLDLNDLRDWRGKSDLLPEFHAARQYDVTTAPKTSNRGMVASSVMEIPEAVGFLPLFSCEFDLNYSPLLQFNYGKGAILFSSLDFSGRVGNDPAATLLASNLIAYAARIQNPGKTAEVFVNLPAEELEKRGIHTTPVKLQRIARPQGLLRRVIQPNQCRFRDWITIRQIISGRAGDGIDASGTVLIRDGGPVREIYLQLAPELLDSRYENDPARREGMELSILHLKQLVAGVRTFAGESAGAETAARLLKVFRGSSFRTMDNWTVLGPFLTDAPAGKALDAVQSGEAQALTGDLNPNNTFRTPEGHSLDFRKTVSAAADGLLDLGRVLTPERYPALAYLVKEVESPADRVAMMKIGADYFCRVYVNGKAVYEISDAHGAPSPAQFQFKLPLKKGHNVIVCKLLSGSRGFGFWASLSEPGAESQVSESETKELLYNPSIKVRSPYEYYYW